MLKDDGGTDNGGVDSAPPQTFTITRSVNGVVKAHTTGEPVILFYPAIVSL